MYRDVAFLKKIEVELMSQVLLKAVLPKLILGEVVLRILSELLNTGKTQGQKVHPLKSFGSESSLQLVQWSFAKRYLMNAIFAKAWAVAIGR